MAEQRSEVHPILKWWPLIAAGAVGLIGYGSMQTEISDLKDRVGKLETRVDPLRQLKVGKGDLCLKILDQIGSAPDGKRRGELQGLWGKEGCEGVNTGYFVRGHKTATNESESAIENSQ